MTPTWLKLLPASVRVRTLQSSYFRKILSNAGWLFGDRISRMLVGLVVGVWIARYLGTDQFGLMNYAIAFTSLFASIAGLGLNGIVVRDLISEPNDAKSTLGAAFVLQILGGVLACVLAIATIGFARPGDSLAMFLVAILSFAMVFRAADVVKYWFESQVQSKYVVWVENSAYLAFSAIKVGLILAGASLLTFVWAAFAEAVLVAIGLLVICSRYGIAISKWSVPYSRVGSLLKDSWPLMFSGLAIMIYMRIDQVMLGVMLGDKAVGVYTAAVRISEVWYFVPTTIAASLFPAVIAAKDRDPALYQHRLQRLYELMVWIALAVAVPMTFLSGWIVRSLFGSAYAEAGPVLAIHIWAGVFVTLGVASGKWFLVENLPALAFYRTLFGAIANFALNLIVIPRYGAVGAALATVFAQALAAYFFDVLNPKTRAMFWMKTKAFTAIPRFDLTR